MDTDTARDSLDPFVNWNVRDNRLGGSSNFGLENLAAEGGTLGTLAKIGGALMGRGQKVQAEQDYYTILRDCLENKRHTQARPSLPYQREGRAN